MPDKGPIVGVIPARYGSTRFPGKALALIAGKPMIQRVYEVTSQARLLSRLIVATDDRRIADTVRGFGGEAMITRADHRSGTDRVAEVANRVEAPYYINVQGDEPLIRHELVDLVARMLLDGAPMATLAARITSRSELLDQNTAKVVLDRRGDILYFSRHAIPFPRKYLDRGADIDLKASAYYRHIGTYGYNRAALTEIAQAEPCEIEDLESLEQLRALFLGIKIKAGIVDFSSPCVDVPEDIAKVEKLLHG